MAEGITAAILIVTFLIILPSLGYMQLFGLDRMLTSQAQARLEPGEVAVFESLATRAGLGLAFIFTIREGYLVVTTHRLLISWWVLPPFWRTAKEFAFGDIDEVTSLKMFGRTEVILTVRGKKLGLIPRRSRFWPFGHDIGPQLLDSIKQGRAASA